MKKDLFNFDQLTKTAKIDFINNEHIISICLMRLTSTEKMHDYFLTYKMVKDDPKSFYLFLIDRVTGERINANLGQLSDFFFLSTYRVIDNMRLLKQDFEKGKEIEQIAIIGKIKDCMNYWAYINNFKLINSETSESTIKALAKKGL